MGAGFDRLDGGRRGARTALSGLAPLVEVVERRLNADCCEFLVEEDDRLVVRASSGSRPMDAERSHPRLLGIPGRAYSTGTACVIDDCRDTRRTSTSGAPSSARSAGFRSLCCVPVGGWGLLLAKAHRPRAFTERDQHFVERLVHLVGSAPGRTAGKGRPISDGGVGEVSDHAEQLEELADILSHDLMNPLNVAQGNLELARSSGDDQYLERASAALHRMEELIDEAVFLARTGERVEQTEPVDLRERAEAAWENVQPEEATLDVVSSVTFSASKRGVCHVLENFIENAVIHAGSDVTLRIGGLDDGFFIEDDGPGIPDEHWEQLFDRGYTVESGTSGLGLHIVKRIAAAHEWQIAVGASSTGGARFEITGVGLE